MPPLEVHSVGKLGRLQKSAAAKAREELSIQTHSRRRAYCELSATSPPPVASTSRQRISPEPEEEQLSSQQPSQQNRTDTTPQVSPVPSSEDPVEISSISLPDKPAPQQLGNPQATIMANAHVTSFKIPTPWDASSPKFDGRSALSLKQYIRYSHAMAWEYRLALTIHCPSHFEPSLLT